MKPAARSSITDTHSISVVGREREEQRRVARARAGDRVAHAAARELVDERLQRRVGAVDRDHGRAPCGRRASRRVRPRLHAARRRLGAGGRAAARTLSERLCSTIAEHTLRGPAGRDRGAGEGAVLVRLLAGRAAGAARRAARAAAATAALVTVGAARASRIRRARGAGPRPTRSWPPGWRRSRSRRSWRVWERQPLFADQSDALVEAQRPGRLSHDPRALALLLRTAGQGALAGLGRLPRARPAGARDRRGARRALRRAPRERMARAVPRRARGALEDAGHAPSSSGRTRWRPASSSVPRRPS